jgi:hypothetical protein
MHGIHGIKKKLKETHMKVYLYKALVILMAFNRVLLGIAALAGS